jgi:Mg-chelatase subunit ChlD
MVDADCVRRARQILTGLLAAVLLAGTVAKVAADAPAPLSDAQTRSTRIALLVDTSEGMTSSLTQVRAGLRAFVDALPAEPELLVTTTGRRTAVRLQPTTDRKKARNSVGGLIADGGPTPLMDSILEVDERFMRAPPDRRSIFVIVTGDGTESSIRTSPDAFNQWLATLRARDAVAHALVVKSGNGMPEVVARAIVQGTSGLFQSINPGGPISDALRKVAVRIADADAR